MIEHKIEECFLLGVELAMAGAGVVVLAFKGLLSALTDPEVGGSRSPGTPVLNPFPNVDLQKPAEEWRDGGTCGSMC